MTGCGLRTVVSLLLTRMQLTLYGCSVLYWHAFIANGSQSTCIGCTAFRSSAVLGGLLCFARYCRCSLLRSNCRNGGRTVVEPTFMSRSRIELLVGYCVQ